jgi:crossover junction endodeoxyribonuclease RusA
MGEDRIVIDVKVYGTPAPQGSKTAIPLKGGKVAMRESSRAVKPWREAVKTATLDAPAASPGFGPGRPVAAVLLFYLKRPKDHYGTGRNEGQVRPKAPAFPTGSPDVDKLARSTLDGLRDGGAYRDDAQVVSVVAVKHYATETRPPGAAIRLRLIAT